MSAKTAREALEEALSQLGDQDEAIGVSPTVHDVSTVELYEIADQACEAREANVEIGWRDDGALIYERWGAR